MFERDKIPIYVLLFLFFIAITLHFSYPNWASKEYSDKNKATLKKVYINNFDTAKIGNWSDANNFIELPHLINEVYPYSSTLVIRLDSIHIEDQKIKISCFGFSKMKNNELYAILSVENSTGKLYYRPFPINIKSNEWFNYRFEDILPESLPEESVLKYYIWNKSGYPFLIRQLKLEIN